MYVRGGNTTTVGVLMTVQHIPLGQSGTLKQGFGGRSMCFVFNYETVCFK
jgi:hypothetical protein